MLPYSGFAVAIGILLIIVVSGVYINSRAISKQSFQISPNQEFTLSIGESAVIENTHLTAVRIIEDSRCPSDVNCFWSGQVEVELKVLDNGRENIIVLVSQAGGAFIPLDAAHKIKLTRADPPRGKQNKVISESQYDLTFIVETN